MTVREFVVHGTPVSLQGKARSKESWRSRVTLAAQNAVPEEERLEYGLVDAIAVWLVYFHLGEMDGDLDNIAKPILDALIGVVWSNDRQIARLTLRRLQLDAPGRPALIDPPEPVRLAVDAAMRNLGDFVYVRATIETWDGRVP